jgi:putative transposase
MTRQWSARTLPPDLADSSAWRMVDVDALSEAERERFLKYQAAIEAYLRTGQATAISKELGLPKNAIVRQLNRCVTLASDGKPFGWAALVRSSRTAGYERKAPLPHGRSCGPYGGTGAFKAFLFEHSEIKQCIDSLVFKRAAKGVVHEAKIALKNIHAAFVACCEDAGITGQQYPLNSKSKGRRSLERYVQTLMTSRPEEACRTRFGATARSHLNVGRGRQSSPLAHAPFDVVGIDPHKIDCIGTIKISGPKGLQRVAMERLWIVPVVDDYSRAILGYSVGIRTECSATTIEEAIICATTAWRPRDLKVPGMIYAPNAALPSGAFPSLVGRGWAAMMVDNAAVHYSNTIAERARRRIGCAVNYGPIGHWEHRPALERVMKTLEAHGFQRLPSTTGSSPLDPAKSDPGRKAIEHAIDLEMLLDVIDVVIANYNALPNEALGNRSPLSLLRDYVDSGAADFLPRRLPPPIATSPELGITLLSRFVRGNMAEGRRPYIEIDRVHYTSPLLSSTFGLIGKKLRVHVRDSNMCTVMAYHESGEELGALTAQGAWGRTPHTREMRQQINALRDNGELVVGYHDNPIVALLRHLGSETFRDAETNPTKVSRNATKLARAAAGANVPIAEVAARAPAKLGSPLLKVVGGGEKAPETGPLSSLVKPPRWKTIIR